MKGTGSLQADPHQRDLKNTLIPMPMARGACVWLAPEAVGARRRERERRDESRYFVFWFQRAETSVQDAGERAAQRLSPSARRGGLGSRPPRRPGRLGPRHLGPRAFGLA